MRKFIITIVCLSSFCFFGISQEDLTHWFHLDKSEGYMGVSSNRAFSELLHGRESSPIVVAIIDSGIDIEHEDLADNIWKNIDEIPNNNIDDDKNGYVDDVYGWNFIGGADGSNVGPDTYEVTRQYAKYLYKFEKADPNVLNGKDRKLYDQWLKWKEEVDAKIGGAKKALEEIDNQGKQISNAFKALGKKLQMDSLEFNTENIESIVAEDEEIIIGQKIALQVVSQMDVNSIEELNEVLLTELEKNKKRQEDKIKYAYNPEFDTRKTIVKDNYQDGKEKVYGNNDVEGPDALHGTHVAGIVGAIRNNNIGMNGLADNVLLMSIRTVPDGDERDKDVANAIRYAVDNGASIINMSFGKGYANREKLVDEAIKYAEKNDVLLVHAAGNSHQNNDVEDNFPNDKVKKGWWIFKKDKEVKNWLEVGALSFKDGEQSVATFSNYGQANVDVFAPGVQIYAPVPNDKYMFLRGTSMASPVVAGIAAVLRSYFPSLTAEQTKDIIESSVESLNMDVTLPGADEKVAFSKLSKTGGVANMYNAVKLAMKIKGKKKITNVNRA